MLFEEGSHIVEKEKAEP